ncbi:hypothetical protein C2S53_004148 [Perilla frutescens var. hirtella]|uniref:SP-RING-type domain-containing protein n=1 Tax=Perilla frutescens var. hirtella TaxID=608512 RepID=A0AAD4JAX3_PERFH|nr:hypothetical protein C2S53_004148 [Perilla frutescens var. hirtella]
MAGMAVTAAPATGTYATQTSRFSPSELNGFRIGAVIDRLSIHLHNNSANDNEGIDFSIANHEVPTRSLEIPTIVKKVCQTKNDSLLQAPIFILMVSVKSACQNGWFSNRDSEELSNLAKKIASNFCSASDFSTEPNPSHPVISTVMSRFYPRLKMGHIFVFLEVKPGYDAYVSDFQISKNLKCSQGDRIRLFVLQTDSIETSACLVTPAKVNFLLNGKGVERRTNLFMDTGPQVPTIVTPLLKYGSNLLQAVGEFNGNYIIVVAFMGEVPNPDSNTLQNCEQHAPATVDADSEVIEGPSRITLNCPISFRRIKTPVKGISCKHIQCFDFDNYVDMNSRRPSWRCPHCNQHLSFSDIRIDQKMCKILKEVGPNVSDIIVSSDGSWNAVMESEDTTEKAEDNTSSTRDESTQPADIMDLTQTDDPMDIIGASEIEDIKLSSKDNAQTTAINTNDFNQSSSQVENDFWAGIYMSTFGQGSLSARPNVQTADTSASTSVLTEPFASTNREVGGFHHNAVATTSAPQIGASLPNTIQFPQYQLGNPTISDYGGRLSSVPRHITRTASAVQALPAQTPTSILQRSLSNGGGPFTPNGLSAASQASPTIQNLTASRASPHQVPPISSSSPLLQHSNIQQNRSFPPARPPQQNTGFLDPNQVPNMYRVSNEHQSSSQPTNFRSPRSITPSPGVRSITPSPGVRSMTPSPGVSQSSALNNRSHLIATANRAVQMSVGGTRTVPSYSWNPNVHSMQSPTGDQRGMNGATPPSQPATRTDAHSSADPNWRPAARMRGALSGQAYADAFNRYITQPNQQTQAARPISNTTPLPNNARPNLQAFMAGGAVPGIQVPNLASAAPVGRPSGSDALPNGSSGMH